jgi:hypothetical protein
MLGHRGARRGGARVPVQPLDQALEAKAREMTKRDHIKGY